MSVVTLHYRIFYTDFDMDNHDEIEGMMGDVEVGAKIDDLESRIGNTEKFDAMVTDIEINSDSLGEPASDEWLYNLFDESKQSKKKVKSSRKQKSAKVCSDKGEKRVFIGRPITDEELFDALDDGDFEDSTSNKHSRDKVKSSRKQKSTKVCSDKGEEVVFADKVAKKSNIFNSTKEYGGKRKEPKPIVELDADAAMTFLMESEQYFRTELPNYFDFSEVLKFANESVGEKSLRECCVKGASPAQFDNVNLEIMTNKDGRYGVRPLTLANPFLYYMMVRDICSESAWKGIQECFALYKDRHISACAIPMVKMDDRPEAFHGSTAVLNWWNSMEQTSIELSLKYRYMFVTDITNCFGQINPESIGWALSLKNTEHETSKNDVLAKNIQEYLRAMQHGRNMGIPQGSTLFSFIAEIILGYSDMLLAKEVREAQERKELPEDLDYHVLRYVDDYRIFCSNREALDRLSYILQEILERFNFRMNSSKTRISDNIISDSIKSDKMFYIFNTPIESKQTFMGEDDESVRQHAYDFDGFQKHLLFIYEFSRRFPNSGQLKNQLSAFSRRLEDFLNSSGLQTTKKGNLMRSFGVGKSGKKEKASIEIKNHLWENKPVMVAIAVEIAASNVSAAHYALKVASQILADMTKEESEKKLKVIRLMYDKLRSLPNSAFTQLWLQNITHTSDDWSGEKKPYDMPLCRIVAKQPEFLWNNSWLKKKIIEDFPIDSIVDRKVLEETGQVISFKRRTSYDEDV